MTRLTAYRRLETDPLVVLVQIARDDIFAEVDLDRDCLAFVAEFYSILGRLFPGFRFKGIGDGALLVHPLDVTRTDRFILNRDICSALLVVKSIIRRKRPRSV